MTADRLHLVIAAVDDTVPGIRSVTLVRPDGAPLPGYTPGSHVVVHCGGPGGTLANAYSLTGDSVAPESYAISVLHLEDGRGGSRWIHELATGDRVEVTPPRSAFPPVLAARRHLLVAAGIGVTPVLSHVRSAARWGREVEVLYAHRPGRGAHLAELAALAGDALHCFTDRDAFAVHLERTLAAQPIGTHLYTCGPASFMDAVTQAAYRLGWPASRVHLEHFGLADLDEGEPFEAVLTASGRTVAVPSGVSLLDALEAEGVTVPNLCRQGVCGECRIPVRAGTPWHRDLYLSDDEKAAGDTLMCCVSRAAGDRLEIDL